MLLAFIPDNLNGKNPWKTLDIPFKTPSKAQKKASTSFYTVYVFAKQIAGYHGGKGVCFVVRVFLSNANLAL